MPKITDKDIAKAVREMDEDFIRKVEEEEKRTPHVFSQRFAQKMHEIYSGIDPETGTVTKAGKESDD